MTGPQCWCGRVTVMDEDPDSDTFGECLCPHVPADAAKIAAQAS